MSKKSNISFPLLILTIVIFGALIKDFNFKTMQFNKPWIDALYAVSVLGNLYLIIKNYRKNE